MDRSTIQPMNDLNPTCPRCGHTNFYDLNLLSEEFAEVVRRQVQCTKCSFTGILVAAQEDDEDSDSPVGEWE